MNYERQRRFDSTPIGELALNFECRDEMVPILAGLKYIYTQSELRREVVDLVAADIYAESRRDVGPTWPGRLADRGAGRGSPGVQFRLRQAAGPGGESSRVTDAAGSGRVRRGAELRGPADSRYALPTAAATLATRSRADVLHGQALHGKAAERVRANSFVVETNVHYPTESSPIGDGLRASAIPPIFASKTALQSAPIQPSNQFPDRH